MKVAAIFGPKAGERDLRPFRLAGMDIAVHADREPLDSPEAALIFGGDGTVHHYLAALIDKKIPFLVVPKGSGNDFARAVGMRDAATALAAWRKFAGGGGNVRAVDAGEIRHSGGTTYYCCVAGAGLDSATNRLANSFPAWLRGHGGYPLALLWAVARFKPATMTVTPAQGPSVATPAMMVAVANAPSYGSGMRIAPRALLEDGQLDVCVVRRVGAARLLRLFPKVYRGRHLDIAEVTYFQSDSMMLEADRGLEVYADGEYVGQTPVQVRVLRGAMRVISEA